MIVSAVYACQCSERALAGWRARLPAASSAWASGGACLFCAMRCTDLRALTNSRRALGSRPICWRDGSTLWSTQALLERRRYSERPPRYEYVPTACGRDFRPILVALLAWGNKHFAPEGPSVQLVNAETGARRSGAGGWRHRTPDQGARIRLCAGALLPRAHASKIRIGQAGDRAAIVELGARDRTRAAGRRSAT